MLYILLYTCPSTQMVAVHIEKAVFRCSIPMAGKVMLSVVGTLACCSFLKKKFRTVKLLPNISASYIFSAIKIQLVFSGSIIVDCLSSLYRAEHYYMASPGQVNSRWQTASPRDGFLFVIMVFDGGNKQDFNRI